jgi:hypothetical protein
MVTCLLIEGGCQSGAMNTCDRLFSERTSLALVVAAIRTTSSRNEGRRVLSSRLSERRTRLVQESGRRSSRPPPGGDTTRQDVRTPCEHRARFRPLPTEPPIIERHDIAGE